MAANDPLLPSNGDVEDQLEEEQGADRPTIGQVVRGFTLMGWTTFGGPQAHIGMFETYFVKDRQWMAPTAFMELFALASCLPGPTSTQVAFALTAVKRGIRGGVLGGVLFQFPGLVLMSAVGVGAASALQQHHWWSRAAIDGLGAMGVALVAVAAKGLVAKAAKDRLTSGLIMVSAVLAYLVHASWLFPAIIVAGGLITWSRSASVSVPAPSAAADGVNTYGLARVGGAVLLTVWAIVLLTATIVRVTTDYADHWVQPLHWFEAFYRAGSLIYGGGQVVLPMLMQETVKYDCHVDDHGREHCVERPDTWVTSDEFKTGLAIIQAMPGPMFNLSAYLGAVIAVRAGWSWAAGVAACWLGLSAPGVMVMYGVMPFWGALRGSTTYRRALPGLNAAAVGLVVAAVFDMYLRFTSTSMFPRTTVAIGIVGFGLVDGQALAAPLAVLLGGLLGVAAGYFRLH